MIIKFIFEENDVVKLPHNQIGVIKEILELPWGFKYRVEIIRNTLSQKGDIEDFKVDQLSPIIFNPMTFSIDDQCVLFAKIN
jgi:hypothetical protein